MGSLWGVLLFSGAFLFCSFLMIQSTALAANGETAVEIQNVKIGIDGYFHVGRWAPIEFDVVSTAETVQTLTPQIRVADPDGHGVLSRLKEFKSGGTVHVQGLFRSGKLYAPVTIEILNGEKIIAELAIRVDRNDEVRCLKQSAHLWLLDGEQPAFQAAAENMKEIQSGSIHAAPFGEYAAGIFDPRALEPVNLIVLNGDSTLSESSSLAIRDWVYRGGRLVICIGEDGESLRSSPISSWLPVLPQNEIQIRNLSGFNQWVPGSNPMRMLDTVPCAVFSLDEGQTLASDFGNALAIRSACGTGSVTMLGVRLDQRPFNNWSSRAEMAMVLADFEPSWTASTTAKSSGVNAGLSPTGISDFQTQLIQALDHYDVIKRPSYWVVIAWSSVLILIIGPLDYLIVHRLAKRPQLTWITLPVWLGCITLWSYNSAFSINNTEQQSRQIEILDVDLTTNTARGRSWMNFYSTLTRRYKIEADVDTDSTLFADPQAEETQADFLKTSWIERPESSYRGMYRTGGLESRKAAYHLSSDDREIKDLPVRVWSTGSAGTEWELEVDPSRFAQTRLHDPGSGRLTGSFTYQGSEELTGWFVAYGNFAYFPRTEGGDSHQPLRPGDLFELKNARSNMLKGLLTGLTHSSIFHSDDRKQHTSLVNRELYNSLSRDPFPILRTLSFHDITGGQSYTKLTNDSLDSLDLSDSLKLHRAVLFGRLKAPVTKFALNDDELTYEQQESVIRIIMPVEFELADLSAPPDPTLLRVK